MLNIIWNEAESIQCWNEGRNDYISYLFHLLNDLGLSYMKWTPEKWIRNRPTGVTLVTCDSNLREWENSLWEYCRQGNSLLALGGTHGLDKLLGVSVSKRFTEGWIHWKRDCPLKGLRSSFHFFGAVGVNMSAIDVDACGRLVARNANETRHPAYTERMVGAGLAALLTFDIAKSVSMIQQGVSVERDGYPAVDGTAAIDEGILKTDDGSVLDWHRDRNPLHEELAPYYRYPVADEMKLLFIRILANLHRSANSTLAQLWFWPEGIEAIGHISHDSDGNDPQLGRRMLEFLDTAEVRSTWCMIDGGYPSELMAQVHGAGHEIALHYDALDTAERQGWSEERFLNQLAILTKQLHGVHPTADIVTNKNHYLRWEGDYQFYEWCERVGIVLEQSKGGTKQGNKGFLFGTCHPYQPRRGPKERNQEFKVYSLPTLGWDPPIDSRCTEKEAYAIMDECLKVHGVSHFLFHPAMLANENPVGHTMVSLVRRGRGMGMEWWTGQQIVDWLRLKNNVDFHVENDVGEITVVIHTDQRVKGVTILLDAQRVSTESVRSSGAAFITNVRKVCRYGMSWLQIIMDMHEGTARVTVIRETNG